MMNPNTRECCSNKNIESTVENICAKYNKSYGEIDYIALMQEIQDELRYLPKQALKLCSEKLNVPLSQLYSLATFYNCFSLNPKGKYEIHVCIGTACHVRNAGKILDKISQQLNIKPGETSKDMNYSLETVNCVGACALGPLVTINGQYRGNLTMDEVGTILAELKDSEDSGSSDRSKDGKDMEGDN